ncbi:hypothetical protein Bequi_09235 [Brachybacterium sp. JHP9]|uniref:4-hydroxybenzoate polyprenyltransferase n=1 Tax=Brachybacterium equifaecis TaxID=2910770 RepID=A0ABT0R104_9MICO|nr:hypothetical protein [Brachybacterium equifaecis]MCL6423566.1 hypothetical protein [Brachybacterium equifaecis]
MLEHVLILAEGAAHSEGVPPWLVGLAMFAGLMLLLLITYLFSGMNQRGRERDLSTGHAAAGHRTATATGHGVRTHAPGSHDAAH